jgi:sulfur carrier protein ThiS
MNTDFPVFKPNSTYLRESAFPWHCPPGQVICGSKKICRSIRLVFSKTSAHLGEFSVQKASGSKAGIMKVRVNLYGTFRQRFPGYQHSQGMEVEIQERATVKDLLALLEISESQGPVVIAEGRILGDGDEIQRGVPVNVLQVMRGG